MLKRSTGGVKLMSGGKWPPSPIGATTPGPRIGESNGFGNAGERKLGSESTCRSRIVDWLSERIVREVNGAPPAPIALTASPLANDAAVRALATAPSIAKASFSQ